MAKKTSKRTRRQKPTHGFGNWRIPKESICTTGGLVEGREEEPYERIAEYWEDKRGKTKQPRNLEGS